MQRTLTFHKLGLLRRWKWRMSAGLQARRRRAAGAVAPGYDIAVTTYIARFDTYFKSLLCQLCCLFPDRRVIVVANGHHDRARQDDYLIRLQKHVARHTNVTLIAYSDPEGLARMWNDAIRASSAPGILMLNDDLYLMPHFRNQVEGSGMLARRIATLNGSWSHFWIAREIVDTVGWFDERFTEIGYEDADYEARLACSGLTVDRFEMNGVWNCVDQPAEYSYGAAFEVADGKYSGRNRQWFHDKWETSAGALDGGVFIPMLGRWVRLRHPVGGTPPC